LIRHSKKKLSHCALLQGKIVRKIGNNTCVSIVAFFINSSSTDSSVVLAETAQIPGLDFVTATTLLVWQWSGDESVAY
jgi:hypothetical protein